MNKAFVREPDQTDQAHCPRCGSLGAPVGETTLDAFLAAEHRGKMGSTGYFCPFARCDVAYFDTFERLALVTDLVGPVYPKNPDAPLCGCFGVLASEIEADAQSGQVARVRELLAKAKSAAARCAQCAADGQSCVGEVQRHFMKHRRV
jgi:hypothetical protein